jgi:hypothetical protein
MAGQEGAEVSRRAGDENAHEGIVGCRPAPGKPGGTRRLLDTPSRGVIPFPRSVSLSAPVSRPVVLGTPP